MKTSILWIISIGLPLFVGCSQGNNATEGLSVSPPNLVRAASGAYLSLSCLQSNGAAIATAAQISTAAAQQEAMQCDINNLSSSDYADACKSTVIVNNVNYQGYYYPPAYQGSSYNSFNSYVFGGYNVNAGQILGYSANCNPYPPEYQPYPYGQYPSYSPYSPYSSSVPYNTYYNQPSSPSNQFCNTNCLGSSPSFNVSGCSNSCWFNTTL